MAVKTHEVATVYMAITCEMRYSFRYLVNSAAETHA
jgi:hypothetical protein